ncbi:MAG TPA: hypothetical protein VIU34_08550, partial [Steroidobacter sp.]
ANSFRVVGRSAPPGTYAGDIEIRAGQRFDLVHATYTVTAPPGGAHNLEVAPTNLTLSTTEGASTAPVLLNVTPATWDPAYSSRIEYDGASGWLSATATNGGYNIIGDAANLAAGAYSARIFVSGDAFINLKSIPVSLTVGVGLVRPADITTTVTSETTPSQLAGSIPVTVAAGPVVNWVASSDQPWLTLSRAAGATGTNLEYAVDTALFAALANHAQHVAHVTIDPAPAGMSSVTFAIEVNKGLAQVTGLGPYLQVSDRPLRVIVRGRGFDDITNPATRVLVDGMPAATVQRRGDTEVLITAPAQAAGTYRVRATNALGLTTANREITVVDPRTQVAATVATGGTGSSIIYDAKNDAVYFANLGLSAVQRFTPSGGSWVMNTVVPIPALEDIGLSNDGADLVALSLSGSIPTTSSILRFLNTGDPALSERTQLTRNPGLGGNGFGLQVTNDSKIWFSPLHAGADAGRFVYLDTNTQTFGSVAPPAGGSVIGPGYFAPRDGSRLHIVQNRCCTPTPPMLYMDATDLIPRINPANPSNFYAAHASDDGERLMFDRYQVYNNAFAQIGDTTALALTQGSSWFAVAGVVSPDGSRAYLVAYNDSEISYFPTPTPTLYPRVYVFDASAATTNTTRLPLLGYFILSDYPTGRLASASYSPAATISPDGRTLFLAGGANFMAIPLPAESALTPP